jgi:hypothetical protein
MTLEQYVQNINDRYKRGNATEHTFRGDLQQLIESLVKDVKATNEPKRQSCGAPDYILTKKEIPVGFIEAKNVGDKDLDGSKKTGNKEQFDRYKASLGNLIFTDYLDFHLYPETNDLFSTQTRTPNLNPDILRQITEGVGLEFVAESNVPNVETRHALSLRDRDPKNEPNQFTPIDVLDYIYAVLHSPTYRETYKEFLKIDFPRVPYPAPPQPSPKERELAVKRFWQLVRLGGELRQIHLLESSIVEKYITQYPIDGNNEVKKPHFAPSPSGRVGVGLVYINDTQYFDNVPEIAWNFYIGGYQPAQKWLKDRKERTLEFEDILHYQKIIVALFETDRIMKEIDAIGIKY